MGRLSAYGLCGTDSGGGPRAVCYGLRGTGVGIGRLSAYECAVLSLAYAHSSNGLMPPTSQSGGRRCVLRTHFKLTVCCGTNSESTLARCAPHTVCQDPACLHVRSGGGKRLGSPSVAPPLLRGAAPPLLHGAALTDVGRGRSFGGGSGDLLDRDKAQGSRCGPVLSLRTVRGGGTVRQCWRGVRYGRECVSSGTGECARRSTGCAWQGTGCARRGTDARVAQAGGGSGGRVHVGKQPAVAQDESRVPERGGVDGNRSVWVCQWAVPA